MTETTRRTMLAGAAGISATVVLAACGEDAPDSGDVGDAVDQATDAASDAASAAGGGIAALADIPVGGGKIFADQKVVVTQPTAGQVKAYTTTCTHQACAVTKIENGEIVCPCHQSHFRITDGSVASGPATRPLPSASVKVENDRIVLG
jgi:nitrite reductase/ring-hydroxylating ferredoxin subunit